MRDTFTEGKNPGQNEGAQGQLSPPLNPPLASHFSAHRPTNSWLSQGINFIASQRFYKVPETIVNLLNYNRSAVLQNGTNVTFLAFCTTSIFKKRENVNICLVTRETQNCCLWTRVCAPPLGTTSQDRSSEKRPVHRSQSQVHVNALQVHLKSPV